MQPNIKFCAEWRKQKGTAPSFKYLHMSNNVMHIAVKPPAVNRRFRTLLYRHSPPQRLATSKMLAAANLETTKGRNAHYRIHTKNDGKILLFGTGNCILAGKKTTAAACLSSARLVHMLLTTLPSKMCIWPSHYSCPNVVLTGQISSAIAESIKDDVANVNYTAKFPGIALKVDESKVTPELFLSRGKIIIPGITGVKQLQKTVSQIERILKPHVITNKTTPEATQGN